VTFKGVDLTEIDELVADLSQTGLLVGARAVPIMHRAANNVQRDARAFAPSGPHTPAYKFSITYDIEVESDRIAVEVGPDKDRNQGPLGNIFEYGTSEHAPQAHLGPAIDRESPNFVKAVADLGGDMIGFR
jgi:hypothetical protein